MGFQYDESRRDFHYQLWGEQVISDFALPELLTWTGPDRPAAITIRRGVLDANPEGVIWEDFHARLAAEGWFQSDEPGIARYRGEAGSSVTIDTLAQRQDQVGKALLRAVLYGTVLGGLALQRGLLPLHATSVVVKGQAILLLGGRGSGKSTLAAALWRRGGAVLADDLSAVRAGPDGIRILPGFPGLRLTPVMADNLGVPIGPGTAWQGQRLMLSPLPPARALPAAPVLAVHLLPDPAATAPRLTKLDGLEALARLHRSIFRFGLAAAMGRAPALFAACVRTVAAIPHHAVLRYAPDPSGLDRLASMVLEVLEPPRLRPDAG